MFELLTEHYAKGSGDLNFDNRETTSLVYIFEELADFYSIGDGMDYDPTEDLWVIFDDLAELFGASNDFVLDEDEVKEMYQTIQEGK